MTVKVPVGPARDLLAALREHGGALTASKLVEKTGWPYAIAEERLERAVTHGFALSNRGPGDEKRYTITATGASLL